MKKSDKAFKGLVLIEWLDSHYVNGWTLNDPNEQGLLCRSVGWLVHDGEKAKTIASHLSDEYEPQRCGEMTIPSGAIVKIWKLK